MTKSLRRSALSLSLGIMLTSSALLSNPAQACSTEPLLGSLCVFAGNFAPRGWALANGQIMSISQNTALFSILGTTYGGDGKTTFALPDTRGRAVIGAGSGPGLSIYQLGQMGGVETVTLTQAELPAISPTAVVHAQSAAGNSDSPANNAWATLSRQNAYSSSAPNVTMSPGTITINPIGGGQAHENRPPFIAMNWIIATQGVFPSRE